MNEFCVCLIKSPIFWVKTHDPVFYNHNTYSVSGVFAFRFAAFRSVGTWPGKASMSYNNSGIHVESISIMFHGKLILRSRKC
jgi:hypothetical protein